MHLTLNLLVHAGDRVLVEHPTYPITIDATRRAGARPVPLPVEDGWDAGAGADRAAADRRAVRDADPRLPQPDRADHGRRARARRWPRRWRTPACLTIADETTQSLDLRAEFGRPAPEAPPFAAIARPGSVITLGSMSKSVWGGLRIGWIRAERSLIRQLAGLRAADDLAGPVLEQLAAAHLLEQLGPLVARRRAELARQCRALQAALAAHLPDWEAPTPDGGMVLWCHGCPSPAARSSSARRGRSAS